MIIINVENESNSKQLPSVENIEQWASLALETHQGVVNVCLVSTDDIQHLNQEFRNKNKPTNVLSFPFELEKFEQQELDTPIIGDIVVCPDVIEQEAIEQHKTLLAHWAHIIIHGCLHLIGHDHQHDEEAEKMEQLETELLEQLGYPNPYE